MLRHVYQEIFILNLMKAEVLVIALHQFSVSQFAYSAITTRARILTLQNTVPLVQVREEIGS